MLAPHDRQLLLDMIRPPVGYRFDAGMGTTFTLDLFTLLVIPLSLAMYDRDSLEQALNDPLILLDSLRQNANRLAIFCQAGYIQAPAKSHPLFHQLEKMIVQVQAPNGGVFHPKTWILRYTAENTPPVYRFLNLSRNLTHDRSWDIALCLDGKTDTKEHPNQPLVDFFSALPALATQKLPNHIQTLIDGFITSIPAISFESIGKFADGFSFRPMGIPGYTKNSPPQKLDRALVISPFLTNNFLERITAQGSNHVLISRQDSLDALHPETLRRFSQIYILDQMAEPEDEDKNNEIPAAEESPSGLHAKLIITEKDHKATWLVGSANATDAAFSTNVEFTLVLDGALPDIGIDAVLGSENQKDVLRTLLSPYKILETPIIDTADEIQAEKLADEVRQWLIKSQFAISVQADADGTFDFLLASGQEESQPNGIFELGCYPVTLGNNDKKTISTMAGKSTCQFNHLSFAGLTAFIVFEVSASYRNAKHSIAFILNLPISGLPENRADLLLAEIIANPRQFLRYLRLLLADESWQIAPIDLLNQDSGESWRFENSTSTWDEEDMPLLENLVRALSRSPEEKLESISNLISRLKSTPAGEKLIPPEFDALWSILNQARQELR